MDYADLRRINSAVNLLPYVDDMRNFGTPDFWDNILDHSSGDCDDYAIGKLRKLVEAGMDIKDLRLATCNVETQGYHCVLIASIPEGDYMLDNRQPLPVHVDELKKLGYTPKLIQREGGKHGWAEWKETGAPSNA